MKIKRTNLKLSSNRDCDIVSKRNMKNNLCGSGLKKMTFYCFRKLHKVWVAKKFPIFLPIKIRKFVQGELWNFTKNKKHGPQRLKERLKWCVKFKKVLGWKSKLSFQVKMCLCSVLQEANSRALSWLFKERGEVWGMESSRRWTSLDGGWRKREEMEINIKEILK